MDSAGNADWKARVEGSFAAYDVHFKDMTAAIQEFSTKMSQLQLSLSSSAYVICLLSGPAREWGTAELAHESPVCSSFARLSEELLQTFDPANPEHESTIKLAQITQGAGSVSDYAIEFRTLAACTDWNESALRIIFYTGLWESERRIRCLRSP